MNAETEILFRVEGVLGHITLSRPKALNALSLEMCAGLKAQLETWAADDAVHAVLIDAVPGRAFCAGGDIRIVTEWGRADDPRALQFFATEYPLNALIKRYPKPYVALLDGITMGGGVGISVHGSHRIATENTLFAMPETAIGFFPDIGGSFFLPRCPGAIGIYLGLSGARLTAADLLYAGLATHYVPASRLGDIAPRLARGTPIDFVLAQLSDDAGPPVISAQRGVIDECFSAGTVEEIVARLRRSGPWGKETAEELIRRSPTSLKLALEELRRGAELSANDCLEMEFQIVAEVLRGHDFYEGVRAVLVEKGSEPRWSPARLEDVGADSIARFFTASVPPLGLPTDPK